MGTPRKQRRKFERPAHPWKMVRITAENELVMKYGLKNKREIWSTASRLRRIRDQAKRLLALKGEEVEKERSELISKLNRWGINAKSIDDILALTVESILERRLETVVFRRGMAKTPNQARQFIVHNHVYVGNHKVSVPGYIVLAKEEDTIRVEEELRKVQEGGGKEGKEAAA